MTIVVGYLPTPEGEADCGVLAVKAGSDKAGERD